MKNNLFPFMAAVLMLAFANCSQPETNTEETTATDGKLPVPAEDPAEVVLSFYHAYDAQPDFEKAYNNPILHPDYVAFLKTAKNDDYDAIVNAQDCICCGNGSDTGQCKTETVENTGATAKVKLFNVFGDHHADVSLVNVAGKWQIKAVSFNLD